MEALRPSRGSAPACLTGGTANQPAGETSELIARFVSPIVMGGLVPATHVFPWLAQQRRGWPSQAHGCPVEFCRSFDLHRFQLDDGIAWRPRTRKGSHDEASEFCPARDAGLPSVAGIRRPGRGARGGQVGADAEHEVSVRGAVDRAAVGFLRFARDGGRGEQPGGATVSPGAREIARSTFADANAHRPSAVFEALFAALVAQAGRGLRRTLDGTT